MDIAILLFVGEVVILYALHCIVTNITGSHYLLPSLRPSPERIAFRSMSRAKLLTTLSAVEGCGSNVQRQRDLMQI